MENINKDRKCPRCNEHKQGDKFYNYMSFYCIPCANEFARDRRKKITSGEIYIIKKVKNKKWYTYLDSMGVKYCSNCDNVKPKDKFGKHIGNSISGRKSKCKPCERKIKINKEKEFSDNRYKEYLKSEWYKNYKKKNTRDTSKSRTRVTEFITKLKTAKRYKFTQLDGYKA
jgi:hypothetical protein